MVCSSAIAESLRLSDWLPYRMFIVATRVARPLESLYGERFGLSQAGWRVLAVIAERDGVSASEIGRACGLDPFAVSRAIAQLVDLGFAFRGTGKTDRRMAAVAITDEGRAAFGEIARLALELEARLLATLSGAERAALDRALTKLDRESALFESLPWHRILDEPES